MNTIIYSVRTSKVEAIARNEEWRDVKMRAPRDKINRSTRT